MNTTTQSEPTPRHASGRRWPLELLAGVLLVVEALLVFFSFLMLELSVDGCNPAHVPTGVFLGTWLCELGVVFVLVAPWMAAALRPELRRDALLGGGLLALTALHPLWMLVTVSSPSGFCW